MSPLKEGEVQGEGGDGLPPSPSGGKSSNKGDSLGIKRGCRVMLEALRLIHYLGLLREQGRTKRAVQHNNRLYQAHDRRFTALRKRFRDFYVFNCTPDSGLRAFPYYSYEKAVEYAGTECSKSMDTAGWYDAKSGRCQ